MTVLILKPLLLGGNPNAIKLDVSAGKMYWSDDIGQTIKRANLDGSNIEILIRTPGRVGAFTVDLTELKMYWFSDSRRGEVRTGKIQRANFDGSQIEDFGWIRNCC